jgi:hypothetical protein
LQIHLPEQQLPSIFYRIYLNNMGLYFNEGGWSYEPGSVTHGSRPSKKIYANLCNVGG